MGATVFSTIAIGKTAHEAFDSAVKAARNRYGSRGETGTIAEKDDFVMINVPLGVPSIRYADKLIDDGDPRIANKWGPAGCIKLADNEWLFFGWAYS